MDRNTDIMAADQGSIILNDTTEKTGVFKAIYVLEDTVFNTIKIAGVDKKADHITTPGTAVKAGALIRPLYTLGNTFSAVDLTSGSVALIL